MEQHPCPECERPLPEDAFVCGHCITTAREQLTTMADLMVHADEKRARRGTNWRFGTIGRSPESPLPYDTRVTEALNAMMNRFTGWAREVEEQTGQTWPAGEVALVRWLEGQMRWTASQEWAGDAVREVRHAHDRIVRVFDIPPERHAIGRCNAEHEDGSICPEILAAPASDGWHACPRCGTQHDVGKRRSEMLSQAGDQLVTVHEAVRLLRLTGRNADQRLVRAVVRYVPIPDGGTRDTTDIKGRRRPVPVYPLGKISDALDEVEVDENKSREVRQIMRGASSVAV